MTAYVTDEITFEVTEETEEITMDYMSLELHKILKIEVSQNGRRLDHEVLEVKKQQIDPERLKWKNLQGPMCEITYPVKVTLSPECKAGKRVQLKFEIMKTFRLIPEKRDFFLPCIEFCHVSNTFSSAKYWPKESGSGNSSISYVLPKGLKAVPMTSENPDFISECDGKSFFGWVFRPGELEDLRRWFAAQISPLYFFLLYLAIPLSGLIAILVDCLKISVPFGIITLLLGSYLAARYYLYDKTVMPIGGDVVILTTFVTLLLSVFVDFDSILLIFNLGVVIFPWLAYGLRCLDTRRNRKKNDLLLKHMCDEQR